MRQIGDRVITKKKQLVGTIVDIKQEMRVSFSMKNMWKATRPNVKGKKVFVIKYDISGVHESMHKEFFLPYKESNDVLKDMLRQLK